MIDATRVKEKIDLLAIVQQDTTLRKVANTNGSEYAGACPFCGGQDRFRVQPERAGIGKWFCRGCGSGYWHDIFDYLKLRSNTSFRGALAEMGNIPAGKAKVKTTGSVEIDREMWRREAWSFVEASATRLWSDEGKMAMSYLRERRGLLDETISNYMLGYNPADVRVDAKRWGFDSGSLCLPGGILIVCVDDLQRIKYLKVRRLKRRKNESKYTQVSKSEGWLFGCSSFIGKEIGFLFESEFDTMLASQTGFDRGYASVPAGQKLGEEYRKYFDTIQDLIISFDNDAAGQEAADNLCSMHPRFHKAGKFEFGNDLGEFQQAGGSVISYLKNEVNKI